MTWPRRFALARSEDVSGVSGIGVVAHGVQWPDGTVAMRWAGSRASHVQHDSLENVLAIHGHEGRTTVEWLDPEEPDLRETARSFRAAAPNPALEPGRVGSGQDGPGQVGTGREGQGTALPGSVPPTCWTLDLPYTQSAPLSLNQRQHWATKATVTRRLRNDAYLLIRHAASAAERAAWPHRRVRVSLIRTVTDARRRDADNLVGTLKALADGLVDAGLVEDDVPEQMVKVMPVIQRGEVGSWRLKVEVLEP